MAHGVHPAVKEVKAAALEPVADRPPPEPESEQLRTPDDAVLLPGEPGDDLVRLTFGPYDGLNCSCAVHSLDGGAESVTALHRYVPSLPGSSTSNWTSRP